MRAGSIDLVVANINAEVLVALAGEIRDVRKPGGRAILSGFPPRHAARIEAAFGPPRHVLEKDGWLAFIC